ncbi:sulfatase-like hydrolase/transferase [Maritimibacter alkaliphilus]|uniref:sulfatase-like hydrolase/transferase n=1 Tax=Maritimibacter alkaliphilus TaxID=404236 RepID=UPI001C95B2F1|nr:sulfatase-like hydrolase/transferase [Maritimibacter alkaliphilus]MBY6089591.1 sulfatase-like hydrolase/transferase [Maritimibacter alkaliphilus]
MTKGNVLLVTLDQLSASVLDGDLAAHVPTPNLDRLRGEGTYFANHFTVTVPCGPARASLLTGLYAMNHRAVRNGAPLAKHHATVATEARKSGYEPLLFGYSDVMPDPTGMDPEDPDLSVYEGVAPGFRELVEMRLDYGREWPGYLASKGYDVHMGPGDWPSFFVPTGAGLPRDPAPYAAEHSDTCYLTDRTLMALDIRQRLGDAWFAHLTYIRPHPPLLAPAPYNTLVDPAALPLPELRAPDHPFVSAWFSQPVFGGLYHGFDGDCAGMTEARMAELRAVYLGLVAEVDHHLGRVLDWLDATGQADNTLVVVTADHGEMLGAKRMWGKESVFDPAFHVPLILRVPGQAGGTRVEAITESVDLAPTVLDWIGRDAPPAMDGRSLLPFITAAMPADWRDAALMEADFGSPTKVTRFMENMGLSLDRAGVSILREARWKYVHFGGGVPPMLFDLEADPQETRDLAADPAHAAEVSRMARKLIDRMTERRDRRLTGWVRGG